MAANIDIQIGGRITYNRDGYKSTRVALVSGVTGTPSQVLANAIDDAALPNLGDTHPEIASITLQELTCEPLAGDNYRVLMHYYKDDSQTQVKADAVGRVNCGMAIEEYSISVDGEVMTTQYNAGGTFIRQAFTAEVEVPRANIEFEYVDTAAPTADLQAYLGKINSEAWNGYAAGSVLCTAIDIEPEGVLYRCIFSFAHRGEGWQFKGRLVVAPFGSGDGLPTPAASNPDNDIDYENATKEFQVYKTADFNALGFSFDSIGYSGLFSKGIFRITGFDATLTHTIP